MKLPMRLPSTPIFVRLRFLVFFLGVLCVLRVELSAQQFKTIHDGVEHAQFEHKLGTDPVKINLLRLDLKRVRLDVHHALDQAIGLETTSSIAKRKGAVAAINAGFFRLDKSVFAGDAAGILMIDGELYSESVGDRATLIIGNNAKGTNVFFGNYRSRIWIERDANDREAAVEMSGVNREPKKNEAILYQGKLAQKPNRTPGAVEIRLAGCTHLKFERSSDARQRCRQVEIVDDSSKSQMTNPQFVVLLDADYPSHHDVRQKLARFKDSKKPHAIIRTRINDQSNFFFPSENVDITNGVSHLVRSGKIDITWEQEKASRSFVDTRHPRTAVAKLKDGKFLMITVDGRQPGVSVGMNLHELADYLLALGATDAMNLDGGGSTTMFLDGRVVNTPSDKEGERKIGDAILVTLRKPARQ